MKRETKVLSAKNQTVIGKILHYLFIYFVSRDRKTGERAQGNVSRVTDWNVTGIHKEDLQEIDRAYKEQ